MDLPAKPRKFRRRQVVLAAGGSESGRTRQALKWIAGASAVISFIFAIHQLVNLMADSRERSMQISELERTAATQQDETDYDAAWSSLSKAKELAESGGQFFKVMGRQDRETRQVNVLQENLAMAWMENVRLKPGQKFSEIVDRIEPILQEGAASATGARRGDLLAHIGWGIFLRHRDGSFAGDPEELYKQALKADPHNPYALANWGHWELWNGSDHLESAEGHFRAALAAGTGARPYVRKIQLAALEGIHDEACEAELLRQVNDMREHGEPIDERTRDYVYSIYYFAFSGNDQESIRRLLAAVPPAKQVTTFRALFFVPDFDSSKIPGRQAYLAFLLEAAGQNDESNRTLSDLRLHMNPRDYDYLVTRTDATIKRLSVHN